MDVTPSSEEDEELGYAFDLHLLCGGYAYYSTYSRWSKWGEHYREYRHARLDYLDDFSRELSHTGQTLSLVNDSQSYKSWLMGRGWSIVIKDFARLMMPQWLSSKQCVTGSNNSFTDIDICSKNALHHYASPKKGIR